MEKRYIPTLSLCEAFSKLDNEQIVLTETKKEFHLISDKQTGFKKVEAIILSPEYFAHKNKYIGWTLTDKASGLAIKTNFNTLAEIKDYLKNIPQEDLEKINQAKSTNKYKEQCAKLAAANIDDYELVEDYCYSVFEALEEDRQRNLFEANDYSDLAISFKSIEENKDNLTVEQWNTIKEICEALAISWHTVTSSNKVEYRYNWPYQFQLLYNAWVTESDALKKLEDEEFVNNINSLLKNNADKASKNYNWEIKPLILITGGYEFNNSPNDHEKLCYNSCPTDVEERNFYDIIAKNTESSAANIIKSIEVKFVRNNKSIGTAISNSHGAQLLFIYIMGGTKLELWVKKKNGSYWPLYNDQCTTVQPRLITVDPPSDRATFKILPWKAE